MKTKKDKLKTVVYKKESDTVLKNKERIKNRAWLRESQKVALAVLTKLDEPGWSKGKLAKDMNVTFQQINELVKGRNNLTLETLVKLQKVLDIPILATYKYEVSREDFIRWYYSDADDSCLLAWEVIRMLREKGVAKINLQQEFDNCHHIPSSIVVNAKDNKSEYHPDECILVNK